jgi:hypothetical protein
MDGTGKVTKSIFCFLEKANFRKIAFSKKQKIAKLLSPESNFAIIW